MGPSPPSPTPETAPKGGGRRIRLTPLAWKMLFAGLLLREALSFWTGNPYDLEVWIRTAHAVAAGVNPYHFWPAVPGVSIAYLNVDLPSAAYLPFWPLVTGGLYRAWAFLAPSNRFVLYFLLKQPPILGDLLTAYLLFRVAWQWSGRISTSVRALAAWSLFPYAILISAVWGQFDSIVVAVILATFLVRGPIARNLLYGIGIFVKWITAIYLPLEAFAERGGRRAWVLLALAVPLLATVVVFLSFGWGFSHLLNASTSETHGGGGGMNWVGILTSGPLNPTIAAVPYLDTVLGYLWIPAVVLAGWVAARWFATRDPPSVLRAMTLVTGALLLFRWGLYEQYLLYLFALLFLDVLLFHPDRQRLLGTVVILSLTFLVVDNDFLIRFLAPLSPSITSFTDGLDTSLIYGYGRTWTLIGLCVLVTATLVQLLIVYLRDEPAPVPWWRRLVSRGTTAA